MSKYRIIEENDCDAFRGRWATYRYKIQRRFFFIWFDVVTDYQYTKTLDEARRYIFLTKKGYNTSEYYFENPNEENV